jgi:lipopolysaccharide transport system ATP-binding protein
MQSSQKLSKTNLQLRKDRQGNGQMKLAGFEVLDLNGKPIDVVICGQPVKFTVAYTCDYPERMVSVAVSIAIYGYDGTLYTVLGNEYSSKPFERVCKQGKFICTLQKFPLTEGKYSVNISLSRGGEMLDWVQDAAMIEVHDGDFYGTGRIMPYSHRSILTENKWTEQPC